MQSSSRSLQRQLSDIKPDNASPSKAATPLDGDKVDKGKQVDEEEDNDDDCEEYEDDTVMFVISNPANSKSTEGA
eukprot:scaffold54324_cov37-Prasinocladus_malaysianus.AAC.1